MSSSALATDAILEALDLSRAQPGRGLLEALFGRFNAKVPFENASKIVRDANIEDPASKPRRPEIFWADHLEQGAGGICFARVAAFDALLRELGFSSRKVLGRVERDFDHAALLVTLGDGLWICDVGFPLPALVAAREGKTETAVTDLSVTSTARGFRIDFLSGVPEGPQGLEIFGQAVGEEEFLRRWESTFREGSPFLSKVVLRRCEASRVVSFARGAVRVDDRHSRLCVPLESRERLAELFGMDADLLARAFDLHPETAPTRGNGGLTAYLESSTRPEEAFGAIQGAAQYRRLLEGVGDIASEEKTDAGWRLVVQPAGQASAGPEAEVIEEVAARPERLALCVRRRSSRSLLESEFRVEEHAGRTYLVREAIFGSAREDLLRNDSLRGRLAGALAVDLLAWARLLR